MTEDQKHGLTHERLIDAMAASEDGYWDFSPQTEEVFLSDRYYLMLGYEPGAFPMVLESWLALLHPDDAPAIVPQFLSLITSENNSGQFEFRLKTKTGGWRWILGRIKVTQRDEEGRPIRVSGTNSDITNRKLMEKALVESEARWTSLVDEAPTGISLVDESGLILFVNRSQIGFPETQPFGRNWKEFLPAELHPVIDQILGEIFADGRSSVFETWRFTQDGSKVHFENHAGPVREAGRVKAVVVLTLDVTEQRRADRRREKAALRQRILLEMHRNRKVERKAVFDRALAAAIELTDSWAGTFALYSEDLQIFTESSWSGGELDQRDMLEARNEVARKRKLSLVNDLPASSEIHRMLTIPVFENRTLVGVLGVANKPTPYDKNDVSELQALAAGLWQLHRHREAEESLDRLYQAVEHSPVSLLLMDRKGNIQYANQRFSSMTGYATSEVIGLQASLLRSSETQEGTLSGLDAAFREGREWQGELINQKKGGDHFWAWISVSPIVGLAGIPTHFVEIMEDITERKAMEEMKAQAQNVREMMAQAQKMETVGQLAAGVAHDFNNLLTSVLAFNEMLLRKIEPGNPLRIYAEKIELSGRRAADLVAGLLAVGRQQRLSKVRIDLRQILMENEILLASLVKAPARLEVDLEGPTLWVEADPGQISQVVVNLVSNARDALGGEGTISLSVGLGENSQAWFRVQDNGPGISEELKAKIFDPFFTTKPIGKGTGLGLSIVQGIIQQHQGSITLDSVPGHGTAFTVWLPLASQ